MKQFKIKQAIKPEVRAWCLENLGAETVRWWFDEDLIGYENYRGSSHTLSIDVTEEEESRLMYFILKYDE